MFLFWVILFWFFFWFIFQYFHVVVLGLQPLSVVVWFDFLLKVLVFGCCLVHQVLIFHLALALLFLWGWGFFGGFGSLCLWGVGLVGFLALLSCSQFLVGLLVCSGVGWFPLVTGIILVFSYINHALIKMFLLPSSGKPKLLPQLPAAAKLAEL